MLLKNYTISPSRKNISFHLVQNSRNDKISPPLLVFSLFRIFSINIIFVLSSFRLNLNSSNRKIKNRKFIKIGNLDNLIFHFYQNKQKGKNFCYCKFTKTLFRTFFLSPWINSFPHIYI